MTTLSTATVTAPATSKLEPTRLDRVLCAGVVVSSAPYAVLKVAWLCGSRIGLRDDTFGTDSTMQIGNAVTLFLDIAAIGLAGIFVNRNGIRVPAWLSTFPMWVGYGLLGQILLVVPLTLIGGTVGTRPTDNQGPIEDWVYAATYAGFIGMGVFLLPAFARYAWRRWGAQLGERLSRRSPDRAVLGTAAVIAALGITSLVASAFVSADQARWMIVDGLLSVLAAGGLCALSTGRLRVRRWLPTLAAFAGTGSMFAWGLFHTTVSVIPNDLVNQQDVTAPLVTYTASRLAVGIAGGVALWRALRHRA